jgi:predicted phage terminase large subunit-like protein
MAEDIAEGRVRKAAISMPPGTAKTFVFAVCLPAWILAHTPSSSIMVVTNNKKLSRDQTRNVRKILLSKAFQRNFEARIDENWSGTGDFGTIQGGSVYATSVAGGITGYRADVIIVDDPLSIKDANNNSEIEFVNDTFDDEIFTRMRNEKSRIVVVMHRLNENDLVAHVKRRGYRVLELPWIADKDQIYICRYGVWNRGKGEQLRPGRYTKSELRDLAFKPIFRFLFQQGKCGGESLRIKSRYFQYYDGVRNLSLPVVFSIDTAQKAGDNSSRMVIQVWQTDGRDHFLLDVFAAVCDYQRLLGELERLEKQYAPSLILVEDASSGSALVSHAESRFSCPTRGIVPRGSKSERFRPHFKTLRALHVHVPISADWVPDWVAEIQSFPDGEYDDHVDALSMFLAFMATKPHLESRKRGGGRAVMVASNGLTQQITPGTGPSKRGHIAIARAPSCFQRGLPQSLNGRASLESGSSIQINTPLGPVIIRR